MKLLCTESDMDICNEIVSRLADAGIDAEMRERAPSLFDIEEKETEVVLYEIWAANDEDAERANAILYPPEDPSETE